MWQQPRGKEPGPVSVTRILRDLVPRPGSGRILLLARGTWACDPGGGLGEQKQPSHRGLASPSFPPPSVMVPPAAPADHRKAGSVGTVPLALWRGLQLGSRAWSPWQQARVGGRD